MRLRPGHWVAFDYLVAVACALVVFASMYGSPPWVRPVGLLSRLVIAVALALPVALRRRRPLAALAAAAIVSVLTDLAVPYASTPVLFLPAAYVLYLVAATSSRKVAAGALAALLALVGARGIAEHVTAPQVPLGNSLVAALIISMTWMFGYAVGQRRAYAVQLRDQAATSAVTDERLRIARELHDVVAHSMTVIAVQAGFGRHVIDSQPAQAADALGAIQTTSRDALAEMRRMLGVLRQASPDGAAASPGAGQTGRHPGARPGPAGHQAAGPARHQATTGSDGPAPLMPAPGLADLDRLVSRISQAGVQVDLELLGRRRELPQGIDLSAFRIVQEALTNVVKHAAASRCRIVITYGEDDLTVEVTDDGRGVQVQAQDPSTAEGHGLIGMRERVSLYGGELSVGPLPGRGFRVAARLPLGDDAP